MKITVAGESKEVKDGITIQELIEQENVVEFLYFMGGGR